MNKKLVELIKEEFEKIISTKNGWDNNEIMQAFDVAVSNGALRMLDEAKKIHIRNDDWGKLGEICD